MVMNYWQDDKDLEKAMINSSLLLLKANIKDKRGLLFQKYILSLIFACKVKKIDDVLADFNKTHPNVYLDESQVKSSLETLRKEKIIDYGEDGEFVLAEKKKKEAEAYTHEIQHELDSIVNDVYEHVKASYPKSISQEGQVIANIKSCFNYYFKVASLCYFDIESRKDVVELSKLAEIASENLKGLDELRDQIIYSVGWIINNPNEAQQHALETMARIHVSAQMMNIDPLLSKFKATQIKGKTFILDTDVVLHAITKNASCSKQYRMMIDQLKNCGCVLYVPEEIIQEVYNHAEASIKRYPFVSIKIGINDEDAPKLFKNVFIEDYHYHVLAKNKGTGNWINYIRDYYDPKIGVEMTTEIIEEELGERINYGSLPKCSQIDNDVKSRLYEAVLEETQKTDKALHRDFEKNEDIANADTIIYLTVKNVNSDVDKENKGKKALLMNDCYFLSSSNRVHYCAKELGLESDVICNPKALLAYLAETGYVDREKIQFTKLFDNPFLIYTAKLVEKDLDAILNAHISLSNQHIVRMRYDLQDEIQKSLSITSAQEYQDFYKEVKSKGYPFEKPIADIMESQNEDKKKIEELVSRLTEAQQIIEEKDNQLAAKDKKIGVLEYQNRTGIKPGKKKNR